MRLVQSINAIILSLAVTTLLGGCFLVSERPTISPTMLALPFDLEGRYSFFDRDDITNGIELRIDSDNGDDNTNGIDLRIGSETGSLVLSSKDVLSSEDASPKWPLEGQLVELAGSDVYLFVTELGEEEADKTDERDMVTYWYLERRADGILELGAFDLTVGMGEDVLAADQNPNYISRVLSLHGLKLESYHRFQEAITGPIDGTVIPKLFRDPAFLGALRMHAVRILIPDKSDLEQSGEAPDFYDLDIAEWQEPLKIADPVTLKRDQVIQLQGLSGQLEPYPNPTDSGSAFVRLLGQTHLDSDIPLTFRPRSDGLYDVSLGENSARVGLLPIPTDDRSGEDRRHLMLISPGTRLEQGAGLDSGSSLFIISRFWDDCWDVRPLVKRRRGESPIDKIRENLMQESARRQGMNFNEQGLSGEIDGKKLLSLLQDGHFATTIETSSWADDVEQFCSQDGHTTKMSE